MAYKIMKKNITGRLELLNNCLNIYIIFQAQIWYKVSLTNICCEGLYTPSLGIPWRPIFPGDKTRYKGRCWLWINGQGAQHKSGEHSSVLISPRVKGTWLLVRRGIAALELHELERFPW